MNRFGLVWGSFYIAKDVKSFQFETAFFVAFYATKNAPRGCALARVEDVALRPRSAQAFRKQNAMYIKNI